MSAEEDLGKLIFNLNPYTQRKIPDTDPERKVGKMDITNIEVEADGPYAQDWTFKGQPQRVGMAFRIRYRFPIEDATGTPLYWLEDYLLLGFEGSMGG